MSDGDAPQVRWFQAGSQLVLGAGDTIDTVQASGQWLKSDLMVDREAVR